MTIGKVSAGFRMFYFVRQLFIKLINSSTLDCCKPHYKALAYNLAHSSLTNHRPPPPTWGSLRPPSENLPLLFSQFPPPVLSPSIPEHVCLPVCVYLCVCMLVCAQDAQVEFCIWLLGNRGGSRESAGEFRSGL